MTTSTKNPHYSGMGEALPETASIPVGEQAARIVAKQCLFSVLGTLKAIDEVAYDMNAKGDMGAEFVPVDMALSLAGQVLQGLMDAPELHLESDFEMTWHRVEALVNLAARAYTPKNATAFGRMLGHLHMKLQALPEVWQCIEMEGV